MQVDTHEIHSIEASSTCSTTTNGECTAANEIMHTGHRQPECVASEKSLPLATRKHFLNTRSPYKRSTCRSPIPKLKRRARTGMEGCSMVSPPSPVQFPVPQSRNSRENTLDVQIMHLSLREKHAISQLRKHMDMYTLLNYTHSIDGSVTPDTPILSLQDYMAVLSPIKAGKSNVVYMQVLDSKSESKDTHMSIMFDLHEHFIERQGKKNF